MTRIEAPSRVQVGPANSVSPPPTIVVTSRDATSTTKTDERPSRSGCGRRLAVNAMRVPSGLQAGSPSAVGPATSDRASPVVGVDEPQVRVVVVDEADAVVLVRQPVDVAVVGQRRLAGLGLRRAGPSGGVSSAIVAPRELDRTASERPSGDQAKSVTPRGRSVRRRASPPSSGSRNSWSQSSRSLASFGRSGSSSTSRRRSEMNARVRPSGEKRGRRSARDPMVTWRAGVEPSVGASQIAYR